MYNGAQVFQTEPTDPSPGYIFKFSDSMWVVQPLAPSGEWLANDYCTCVEGSPCNLPVGIQCAGWRGITVEHCGSCPIRRINSVCPGGLGQFTVSDVACDSDCAQLIADSWETCETRHDGLTPSGQPSAGGGPGIGSIDALKTTLRAVADSCHGLVEQRECTELLNDQQVAFNAACCPTDVCDASGLPDTCSADCATVFMPFFEQCGSTVYGGGSGTMEVLTDFYSQCVVATGGASVPEGARVSCGNPANGACVTPYCSVPTDAHEVRCCSDNAVDGYQQRSGCDVWAESQFVANGGPAGCVDADTYSGARDVCAGDGARLCTEIEVEDACTAGTGCGLDNAMIWTSTTCFPDAGGGH